MFGLEYCSLAMGCFSRMPASFWMKAKVAVDRNVAERKQARRAAVSVFLECWRLAESFQEWHLEVRPSSPGQPKDLLNLFPTPTNKGTSECRYL